jgi:hypothetical protein
MIILRTNCAVQTRQNEFFEEACRLADLGLTVLPVRAGDKRPFVRWKHYQNRRPCRPTLRRWSCDDRLGGLAVIHGAASGGLACRDYDIPQAYHRWAEAHPSLARTLPTSLSRRGAKVYFRTEQETYRKNLGDGELIGDRKHYSCVPPTVHPVTGKPYEWSVPLLALPPILDPIEVGFAPAQLQQTNLSHIDANSTIGTQQYCGCSSLSLGEGVLGELGGEIERVVGQTQPAGPGQRNHCLFRLARGLKGVPQCAGCRAAELEPVVRAWFRLALPVVRTKDFAVTWKDFTLAWERVESSGDGEALAGVGAWVRGLTDDRQMRLSMACEAIQARTGNGAFYLSVRKAAELIGTSKSTAARLLAHLAKTGELSIEEPSSGLLKATVFSRKPTSVFNGKEP